MASPALIKSVVDYYVNLLIIQYHNKPKAQATIRLFVGELLASGVMFDVLNGYNIDETLGPTAVGKQLDVIGKYVGVDRYFRDLTIIDFFGLTFYSELDPDAEPKFGFTTYAQWDQADANGTLTYKSLITVNDQLLDDSYLTLIKLALGRNTMNFSPGAIDALLFSLFGKDIRRESFGNMHQFFFVTGSPTDLIKAIVYKGLLPRPMGVGAIVIEDFVSPTFGMSDYAGFTTPYEYGFSDYGDFDSLAGNEITYDQIFTE